jgi:hypothetical protein
VSPSSNGVHDYSRSKKQEAAAAAALQLLQLLLAFASGKELFFKSSRFIGFCGGPEHEDEAFLALCVTPPYSGGSIRRTAGACRLSDESQSSEILFKLLAPLVMTEGYSPNRKRYLCLVRQSNDRPMGFFRP